MEYEIFPASPKALRRIKSRNDDFDLSEVSCYGRTKYPFGRLEIGYCFIVPHWHIKPYHLRIYASQMGKKLGGKKFTCVDHKQHGIMEVARIR